MDIPSTIATMEEVLTFIIRMSNQAGKPSYLDISTHFHDAWLSFDDDTAYEAWCRLLPGGVEYQDGTNPTRNYYVGRDETWRLALGRFGDCGVVPDQDQ